MYIEYICIYRKREGGREEGQRRTKGERERQGTEGNVWLPICHMYIIYLYYICLCEIEMVVVGLYIYYTLVCSKNEYTDTTTTVAMDFRREGEGR